MQMFWSSLLLTLAAVHATPAVHGNCVGEALEAASFIASAGMQIAVIGEACNPNKPQLACTEHVEKIISAFVYASKLITGAVGTCGGQGSACASGYTNAAHSFTVLVQAATALRHGVNPANLALVGDELTNTANGITDAAASCARRGTTVNTGMGHCVSKAMGASVLVAAAGMGIDSAMETCSTGAASKCQLNRLFILNTLSLASKRSVDAAKDCERNGLLDCGIDISDASAKITEASGVGIALQTHSKNGMVALAPLGDLTTMADALSTAAGDLGSTSYHCVRNSTEPAVHYGTCVGDAIQATAYVAAASVGIGVAVQDCAKKAKHGAGKDSQLVATCMSDLSYVITNYAKTANEIIWATRDCQTTQGTRVQCASDVVMAIDAIGAACASASRLANFAIKDDLTTLAFARDGDGNTELEVLGKKLNAMSSLLGSAVSTCASTPGPAQPEAGGDTADHSAENLAAEFGGSVVQRWNWGSKAKKWLQVGSHHSKGQTKQNAKDIFDKYMVPVAAGTVGLVLLSIVTVSSRLLSRRANARATVQSVSVLEDAELLEELGE